MATTVLRLLPSLELSQMIFLQSLAAEKLYKIVRDTEEEGWKEHRLPELLKAMRDNQQVPDEVLHFVNRYVATRLPHLGKRDDDRRALRITLSKLHPCIIVGTIGMIQNFYNILRKLATHVAIDEAVELMSGSSEEYKIDDGRKVRFSSEYKVHYFDHEGVNSESTLDGAIPFYDVSEEQHQDMSSRLLSTIRIEGINGNELCGSASELGNVMGNITLLKGKNECAAWCCPRSCPKFQVYW